MKWIFAGFLIWADPYGYTGSYTAEETYLTHEECQYAMEDWAAWADEVGLSGDLVDWGASCHNTWE